MRASNVSLYLSNLHYSIELLIWLKFQIKTTPCNLDKIRGLYGISNQKFELFAWT